MKFRKKPIIVDAVQWDGTYKGTLEIEKQFPDMQLAQKQSHPPTDSVYVWKISTREGAHIVSPGDWIIKGVAGEYYPCKPDIFEQTYDAVEE